MIDGDSRVWWATSGIEELSRDETATSEIGFRERGLFEDFFDEFRWEGRTKKRTRVDDGISAGGHVEGWGGSEEGREGTSRKKQSNEHKQNRLLSYTLNF
jgi:hypothetical protein